MHYFEEGEYREYGSRGGCLLGTLIEMGGWALILIVIIPMIFSWLMPGPIQFKKRRKE
jgi:hypothetical protein